MKPTFNIRSLLPKWLSGEIRKQEEKQLYQLAKDDPFLNEALEGYEQFPELDHEATVSRLKDKLRNRTRENRTSIIYFMPRLAAAITLLLVAGMSWWWINSPEVEANLAQEIESSTPFETPDTEAAISEATEADEADPEPESANDAITPTTQQETLPREPSKAKSPLPRSEEAVEAIAEETTEPKEIPADEEVPESITEKKEVAAETLADDIAASEKLTIQEEPPTPQKPAKDIADSFEFDLEEQDENVAPIATIEKESAPPASSEKRLIMGVVKGRDGLPLIGANVSVKGSRQGTITDLDGRFSLEVEQGMNNIEANYTGFESQTLDVSSADNVEFVLEEGMAMDEVVVTGLGETRSKKRDRIESEVKESANPIGGFKKYERYIRRNLRYPKAAKENNISGEVRLQFTVNQSGELSDIKVLQSLGYGCDTEAIRLVEDGPKWQIKSFDGSVITSYAITFKK
jgi:TonB family protein